jgi:hypothetical protein
MLHAPHVGDLCNARVCGVPREAVADLVGPAEDGEAGILAGPALEGVVLRGTTAALQNAWLVVQQYNCTVRGGQCTVSVTTVHLNAMIDRLKDV